MGDTVRDPDIRDRRLHIVDLGAIDDHGAASRWC